MSTTARVLSAEEIVAKAGGRVPHLVGPDPATVFALRAMRLRQLARGHPMEPYLAFVADLCDAQQTAIAWPGVAPATPDAARLERANTTGEPALPVDDGPPAPAWRDDLAAIVAALRPTADGAARETLARIAAADPAWLDTQAGLLLDGVMLGLDVAASPFVAGALQVHWTRAAAALVAGGFEAPAAQLDRAPVCPVCGSAPVASLNRFDGAASGQRYLHCSLCSTQWHVLRGHCTHCGDTRGLAYQSLQASDADGAPRAVVEAETCDACGHYLKRMHADRDAHVEPLADDLATVALDLLLAEAGLQRHGANPLLLYGDPAPDPGRT